MDLYNVVSKGERAAEAEFAGEELRYDLKKVQRVPDDAEKKAVEVLEPSELYNEDGTVNPRSLVVRKGFAEASFAALAVGEIIQFPRYGFVRIDSSGRCILAHLALVHFGAPFVAAPVPVSCLAPKTTKTTPSARRTMAGATFP